MRNSKYIKIVFLLISLIIIVYACLQNDKNKETFPDSLFRAVPPAESGIKFRNQLQETDSANSIFYEYYYNGAGLATGDLNNDGLSDIVFGANMTECRIYLNKGQLTFTDVTKEYGINTSGKWITGVSLVDINHDGWLDIYLSAAGNINYDYRNLLYISNGNSDKLSFTECASKVGLDDNGYTTQAEFFDYDLDGDLDVYLVTAAMTVPNKNAIRVRKNDGSMINTDRLYRNEGIDPQTRLPVFKNVSAEAGITWDGFGLGASVFDINSDGWPDIYVGNDYISNDLLYVNQGNGTFREMVNDYMKHTSNSTMGVDIADFNNDGLTDILTLDMQPEDYFRKRIMAGNMRSYNRYLAEIKAGYSHQFIWNMLQMNNGEIEGRQRFSEIGFLAGISETDWSWAPLFADFNNDGYKDLFIGNGIGHDMTNMDFSEFWLKKRKENPGLDFRVLYKMLKNNLDKKGNIKKPNVIFRNSKGMTFENKTSEWGLNEPLYSTGSSFSDLDNDGDLDLVLNNINDYASVYENRTITKDSAGNFSHYLQIKLSGDSSNTGGIGARITLFYDERLQYYEHFPVRGFQSMVDPKIHFGLGEVTGIDSLFVMWSDRKCQTVYNISSDQLISLSWKEATTSVRENHPEIAERKLFNPVSDKAGINFMHEERQFIDFEVQPLLPHMYSREGPGIAVGDINSDGMDDFYIGGSTSFPGRFFIQHENGNFSSVPMAGENNYEDMGSLFFDADSDGDPDLYVVSGGTGLPPGNAFYSDRLYINNGKGEFLQDKNAIPDARVSGSQVTAADFDRDGDLDLFVCGRVDLENYPSPPRSFLLRNDSKGKIVKFTDITSQVCSDLEHPGLVSAALWSDFNKDGWTDLILAGEWMPVSFFRNNKGKFENVTSKTGLGGFTGWWNSLAASDFDRDGDIDYVAGNLGLNTQYKVTAEQPMRVIAKDFDRNGTTDPVCSYYVQGKSYPIYQRNQLLLQIPSLRNRFSSYEAYALATMDDIFPAESRKGAYYRDMKYSETSVIENLGDGTFRLKPLPVEAQTAPVFGILTDDYNSDGLTDILLTGNYYSLSISDGRYDAFIGLLLAGNGKGGFTPVPGRESGFFADGDAKAMAELSLSNGNSLILIARNSDSLKVLKTVSPATSTLRLKNDEVSAGILFANGERELKEFNYGSGYLSQSSRVCKVPAGAISVTFTSYRGETRTIQLKNK
jgi:enediyne biosynthesis protein E4